MIYLFLVVSKVSLFRTSRSYNGAGFEYGLTCLQRFSLYANLATTKL